MQTEVRLYNGGEVLALLGLCLVVVEEGCDGLITVWCLIVGIMVLQ